MEFSVSQDKNVLDICSTTVWVYFTELDTKMFWDGRKGRGTRDQIANIHWIIAKAREFQKNMYFCFIDYTKAFDHVDHNELWKILQEMGIQNHLTCLLWNLYAGQEATVRTGHGIMTGSKLGKEYVKAVYCHPAYLASMKSTSCEMPGCMILGKLCWHGKNLLITRPLRVLNSVVEISQGS